MSHDHAIHGHTHHATSARDPVCGMDVSLDAGKPTAEHAGTVFHFCSQKCHDKL
jgi:Cu+-exporting ATPase